MNFGKITHPQQLNPFASLPFRSLTQDGRSKRLLGSWTQSSTSRPQVYIGCPIWGKKEWIGKLYPPQTSPADFLRYYALQFNAIELNTSFYKIPDEKTVLKWASSVPQGFRFCPKFFQGISRFEVLTEIAELTQRFCHSVQYFEDHLGLSFLQLPPSFSPSPRNVFILKRFFKLLPKDFQLAVEFRHPQWFVRGQLVDAAFEILADHGISSVITDALGRSDVLHQSLTSRKVLIRFLGNSLHSTDFLRIDAWAKRLGEWLDAGLEEIDFFVHQPEEEGCIELINTLIEKLNASHSLGLQPCDETKANPQLGLHF